MKKNSGGLLVAHSDLQGTLLSQTDATAQVVTVYRNTSYGAVAIADDDGIARYDDPADQVFRYTGEQYDQESGLTYLRARYYDPNAGRFLSRDSWGGYRAKPQSQNRYSYAGNNPANMTDPSGYIPEERVYRDNLDWSFGDPNNTPIPYYRYEGANKDAIFIPGVYGVRRVDTGEIVPGAYYVPLFDVYVFQYRPDWITTKPGDNVPLGSAQAFGNNVIVGRGQLDPWSCTFYHELRHIYDAREIPCPGDECFYLNRTYSGMYQSSPSYYQDRADQFACSAILTAA